MGITPPTVIDKLLHYQIPCPALVRSLTPSERGRIAEIREGRGDDPEHFRLAVVAFINEVWAVPRT